ncbi:hypothetical protein JCM10212_005099 [Sporobolomyces blumeae]
MSSFHPGHHPSLSHSSHASTSSISTFHGPPPAAPSPYSTAATQTRILLVSHFDPSLKTRDLLDLLSPWEHDKGGFKLKWRDDTSAWIVFNDPATAKRAFLSLLTSPPPALLPPNSSALHPSIVPYTADDVPQILQAVQNRPRSRSNAGLHEGGGGGVIPPGPLGAAASSGAAGGHARKSSFSQIGGSGERSNSMSGPSGGSGLGHGAGHARTQSWGRTSLDRRAAKEMIQGSLANHSPSSSFSSSGLPSNPFSGGGGSGGASSGQGWRNTSGSGFGGDRAREDGAASPEGFSAGHGGIVAGEPPRRIGQHSNGHRRSMSDAVKVAGSTIHE